MSSGRPVLDLLDRFQPQGDAETADVARIRELLSGTADPWLRSSPLHVTASAVIVHPETGRVLLRCSGPNKIANHDKAGRDANADGKQMRADCLDGCQGGAHRTVGMRLVGVRPAEIGQHTVADEERDIAALGGHRRDHARSIGFQNLLQIFWIEPVRERR